MTNALIISVLISVPLSVNIISASSSSSYDMRYTSCSDEDSFLVLWNIPISQCVRECHARSLCAAVNYWTRSSGCELLSSHGGLKISSSSTGQPCVYARKPDNQVIDVCQNCDTASVCDATSGNCAIKECRKLHVENAIIKGNMLVVGSKAIVECLYGYTLDRSNPQVVCQANGTWGDIPRCVPEAEWSANDDCIYCVGFSVGCSSDWVHIGTSCYHTPGPLTTMWVFEAIVDGAVDWLIGISDLDVEGNWIWIESGTTSTFYDWITPPDEGIDANFAVLENTIGWEDVDRWYPGVPLCEKMYSTTSRHGR